MGLQSRLAAGTLVLVMCLAIPLLLPSARGATMLYNNSPQTSSTSSTDYWQSDVPAWPAIVYGVRSVPGADYDLKVLYENNTNRPIGSSDFGPGLVDFVAVDARAWAKPDTAGVSVGLAVEAVSGAGNYTVEGDVGPFGCWRGFGCWPWLHSIGDTFIGGFAPTPGGIGVLDAYLLTGTKVGAPFTLTLYVPSTADLDMFLFDYAHGTAWNRTEAAASSANVGRGVDEAFNFTPTSPGICWGNPCKRTMLLVVVNEDGGTGTYGIGAPPPRTPPTASFSVVPEAGDVQATFTVDASSSSDVVDPASALRIAWDWEDDGLLDTEFTTEKVADHQYTIPGTYTILLEVNNTAGLIGTMTRQVVVAEPMNTAPVASFTVAPSSGNVSTTFTVDASGSSDVETPLAALQVRWDWTNDGTWDTPYSTMKTASHRFSGPDRYTIRLQVEDEGGLRSTTTRDVAVSSVDRNAPPSPAFTVSPSAGDTSTTFMFDASASSDGQDAPSVLRVRWDWTNDGVVETSWSQAKTAQHQYTDPDTYVVRVEVMDSGGLTANVTKEVVVTSTVPSPTLPSGPSGGAPDYTWAALIGTAGVAAAVAVAAVGLHMRRVKRRRPAP